MPRQGRANSAGPLRVATASALRVEIGQSGDHLILVGKLIQRYGAPEGTCRFFPPFFRSLKIDFVPRKYLFRGNEIIF